MGLGRTLIIVGAVLIAAGVLLVLGERLPIRLGRLPGDFVYRGKHSAFYFPLATCLLLSAVVSAVMWLFHRK